MAWREVKLFTSVWEKARQRTYDAMLRKAKAHHVAGGKVYGYDNKDVFSPLPGLDGASKRLHVVRVINEGQAKVVRRIFQLYAAGLGIVRIAKLLNEEGVPSPATAGHLRRSARCCTASSIGVKSYGTKPSGRIARARRRS